MRNVSQFISRRFFHENTIIYITYLSLHDALPILSCALYQHGSLSLVLFYLIIAIFTSSKFHVGTWVPMSRIELDYRTNNYKMMNWMNVKFYQIFRHRPTGSDYLIHAYVMKSVMYR